jgi:hypothetical protein
MKKSSRHDNQLDFLLKLAGATRIELATSGVTGYSSGIYICYKFSDI